MAYDEGLATRIRELLEEQPGITEKKMFGGLCLLSKGRMLVGITGEDLMVRLGPERYALALQQPHVREMDFTKKPLKGFVYVAPEGYADDADLARWVDAALAFVGTLPEK